MASVIDASMDFQWRGVPPSWTPAWRPDLIFKFGPTFFVARSSALVCRLLWKSIGSTSPRWRTVSKCLEASSRIDPYCTAEKRRRRLGLSSCFKNTKRTWEMRYRGFSPTTTQPVFLCASACAASVHVAVLSLRNCLMSRPLKHFPQAR